MDCDRPPTDESIALMNTFSGKLSETGARSGRYAGSHDHYEQYVTTGSHVEKITAAQLYNNYTTMLDTLKKLGGKKKNC